MKKFTWRSQKILDVKKMQVQRKKQELMKITESLMNTSSALLTKNTMLKMTLSRLGSGDMKDNFEKRRLVLGHAAVNEEIITKLKAEVDRLESQQKEKITELLKIRQYCQGLESLREQAKVEFYKEQEKIEQRDADENTVMKFARQMKPDGCLVGQV